MKRRARRQPLEINLICQGKSGLYLKGIEVKKTRLDVSLCYNDDFLTVDSTIRKRLNRKGDKGIVLLHGLPGTGKTSYLRYLVGKIKKRVLFIPPEIASRISNPELVQLLIAYPESVLVIEDAENIIMQRQAGFDSSVSNLLNISDGLLSDFLNVQIICTFNSAISTVDEALLRKGRLIARYEFGKLSVAKAQQLSRHMGHDADIRVPMTIAEIANQHEVPAQQPARRLIGFRRELVE
jgi:SpoVK/Ycf46/Vps4 family AAA+-type ATPase